MKHPKPIYIHIPHPCTQNWDEMTSVDQGRFCAHCQKKVTDFTEWSDTALYSFLSKNTDTVCGRFLSSQVNRTLNIPYQPNSQLYRIAVALGLTILFAQPPEVRAQYRPPLIEQNSMLKKADTAAANQSGGIYGRVFDEKKEPVISAVVQVFKDGIMKGGTVTDYDGKYSIKSLEPGYYDILVIYAGYDSSQVTKVHVSNESVKVNFNLNRNLSYIKNERIIVGNFHAPLIDDNTGTKTLRRDEINHMPH